jgi:hypothetical protein
MANVANLLVFRNIGFRRQADVFPKGDKMRAGKNDPIDMKSGRPQAMN